MSYKKQLPHAVEKLEVLLRAEFGRLVETLEEHHFGIRFPNDHPYSIGIVWTPATEVGDERWPHRVSVFCAAADEVDWQDRGVATFLVREMSELPLGRLLCVDDTVLIEHSLFGDVIGSDELRLVIDVVAAAAERTGRVLRSAALAGIA